MNAAVADSGRITLVPAVEVALPPPRGEALMPGATVLPMAHGMARLIDHEKGERLAIFANRELADQCREFLGGTR